MAEATINEEKFNLEVRRFLKKVGVTSQREIEQAVRAALASGALKGGERLHAEITLSVPGVKLTHRVEGEIALS